MKLKPKDRIIVALDVPDIRSALRLVIALNTHVGGFKIGSEFITVIIAELVTAGNESEGLAKLRELQMLFQMLGGRIFWDAKFHDIPTTVARAVEALAKLGVQMFDVHASAGTRALKEASSRKGKSLALAVTILSSLDEREVDDIFGAPSDARAHDFAYKAKEAGFDGIVVSPKQFSFLRHFGGKLTELRKVVVGIRPKDAPPDDHRYTVTATEAIQAGADYLVIGRPITGAPDPAKAAKQFVAEIAEAQT